MLKHADSVTLYLLSKKSGWQLALICLPGIALVSMVILGLSFEKILVIGTLLFIISSLLEGLFFPAADLVYEVSVNESERRWFIVKEGQWWFEVPDDPKLIKNLVRVKKLYSRLPFTKKAYFQVSWDEWIHVRDG